MVKLREYRKRLGLTQKQIAEKIGVTQATVQRWETGKRTPTFAHLLKLIVIFHCKIENLF